MGNHASVYADQSDPISGTEANSNYSLSFPEESASASVEWRMKGSMIEARKAYEGDGTLSPTASRGEVELRALLADPIGQPYIGAFAKANKGLKYLLCWIEIQEFKAIDTLSAMLSKAMLIYGKYLAPGSVTDITICKEQHDAIKDALQLARDGTSEIKKTLYSDVQFFCFDKVYRTIFRKFKITEEYVIMKRMLKESSNFVRTQDFEYVRKLGQGGFGLVVHVIKKSTQQHYAMKIQTKTGLLSCFPDDPWRVDFERQALSLAQHPFIVNLEYAFQTDALAIMVLGLGSAGDLRIALRQAPGKMLPFERVRFYMAEIILALIHMHKLGLIYRDLKPNNVLLNADGHIQLVDFGAITDLDGGVLTVHPDASGMGYIFRDPSKERTGPTELAVVNEDGDSKSAFPQSSGKLRGTSGKSRSTSRKCNNGEFQPAADGECVLDGSYVDMSNTGVRFHDECMELKPIKSEKVSDSTNGSHKNASKRAFTIIGTYGYMAPEMVVLLSQESEEKVGYGQSVDWWSLGCTAYKLLTNAKPFAEYSVKKLIDVAPLYKGDMKFVSRYAILFQEIPEHANIPLDGMDLIKQLLDTNPDTRLGSGKNGWEKLKSHVVFRGLDWEKLELKLVQPPCEIVRRKPPRPVQYTSFEEMMTQFGKESWLKDLPKWKEQKFFDNWDFTSTLTLKKECAVAAEVTEFDDLLMPKVFAADNLDAFISSIIPNQSANGEETQPMKIGEHPNVLKKWTSYLHSKLVSSNRNVHKVFSDNGAVNESNASLGSPSTQVRRIK